MTTWQSNGDHTGNIVCSNPVIYGMNKRYDSDLHIGMSGYLFREQQFLYSIK